MWAAFFDFWLHAGGYGKMTLSKVEGRATSDALRFQRCKVLQQDVVAWWYPTHIPSFLMEDRE